MSAILRVADPAGFSEIGTARPNPAKQLLQKILVALDRLAPPKRPGEAIDLPPTWFKHPPF